METNLELVPDLSYESEFSLAHEENEVKINGAKIVFDKKVPLVPVALEAEKND